MYAWMPPFEEDIRINQVQNEIIAEAAEGEQSASEFAGQQIPEQEVPRVVPKLEQALQISFKAWIRNMISLLKSDCSKRTGDINV